MIGINMGLFNFHHKTIRPILFAVRRRYTAIGRKLLPLYPIIIYFDSKFKANDYEKDF